MNDGFGRKLTIHPNTNYSREEAAKALGVDLRTLKKFVFAGYLRVSRSSGRILIKGESIIAMLDRNLC
jgi:predicted site-specific integrase-resolvase